MWADEDVVELCNEDLNGTVTCRYLKKTTGGVLIDLTPFGNRHPTLDEFAVWALRMAERAGAVLARPAGELNPPLDRTCTGLEPAPTQPMSTGGRKIDLGA